MSFLGLARRLMYCPFVTCVVAMVALSSDPARAVVIYVNVAATGADDGTSWTNAFTSLDDAIAAAAWGDQLWVAEGTYKPDLQPWTFTHGFFIDKPIKLYGGFKSGQDMTNRSGTREATILDANIGDPALPGDNARHVLTITTVAAAPVVIDRFTIKNGKGILASPPYGGGISANCVNLNLSNCLIKDNDAVKGGGLWMVGGCMDHAGFLEGGGDATQFGPFSSRLWVKNCDFVSNFADGYGGGIYGEMIRGQVVTTTFEGNTAWFEGGGVYLKKFKENDSLDFTNCVYLGNSCQKDPGSFGGGLRLSQEFGVGATSRIVNCTFAANVVANPNGGQAVSVSPASTGTIYNSILYFNGDSSVPPPIDADLSFPVYFSDVQGGWQGSGGNNKSTDPLFRNLATGNLRLRYDTSTSPCIDAGDSSAMPSDALNADDDDDTTEAVPDLDLGSRYIDIPLVDGGGQGNPSYLDMGAYERGS